MSNVLHFKPRRPRTCNGCGIDLSRSPSWWTLCVQCNRYHQFRQAVAVFASEVRP